MIAIILDTETTDADAPEIVEVAWGEVDLGLRELSPHPARRFKPSKRISLGALATHHIMDEELEGCPPSSSFRLPDDVQYLIGHNVDFDWLAIGKPEVKRICTLAFSRKFWPEADSHTLGAMLYLLERPSARFLLRNAHSAAVDVEAAFLLLRHIFGKLGEVHSWEDVWRASEAARVPTIMPFGKHKGMAIRDVPPDYKRWLLCQADIDPYLRQALKGAA